MDGTAAHRLSHEEREEQMQLLRAHVQAARAGTSKPRGARAGFGLPGAGRPASGLALRDENGKRQLVTELKHWHKSIVDYFIANPRAKQRDVAKAFEVTEAWLSTLMNTDAFKRYAAERMDAHREKIGDQVAVLASEVATKALGGLSDRLDRPETVSAGEMTGAAKMALGALGIGAGANGAIGGMSVNMTFLGVSSDVLANARAKQAEIARANAERYEHSTKAISHVLDYSPDALGTPGGHRDGGEVEEIEDAEIAEDFDAPSSRI